MEREIITANEIITTDFPLFHGEQHLIVGNGNYFIFHFLLALLYGVVSVCARESLRFHFWWQILFPLQLIWNIACFKG